MAGVGLEPTVGLRQAVYETAAITTSDSSRRVVDRCSGMWRIRNAPWLPHCKCGPPLGNTPLWSLRKSNPCLGFAKAVFYPSELIPQFLQCPLISHESALPYPVEELLHEALWYHDAPLVEFLHDALLGEVALGYAQAPFLGP